MKKTKHIHFVGIKGVGMTALAILAKEAKIKVTGSDIEERFVTDEVLKRFGIQWKENFSPKNIEGSPDLVVVTGAHGGMKNEEAQFAQKKGLKTVMQGEAVGLFMDGEVLGRKNLDGISISGSHGKTTTAAMVATLLTQNNLDPSFLVGCGDIPNLGQPAHFGRGRYFVAEADEYATCPETDRTPKFLWQTPKILLINNIEYDHPDVFEDISQIKEAFLRLTENLPKDGLLVANQDSHNIRSLFAKTGHRVRTFGESPQSEWQLRDFSMSEGRSRFWVEHQGRKFGDFQLLVPGRFNALNALAAMVVAVELGLPPNKIKEALLKFTGTRRRFEFIAEAGGVKLYDDYAHHPTEIASTLSAAKDFFPGQKIICIFQPHSFSRTKILLSDFARSFSGAAEVLLVDIYPSSREKNDFGVSAEILAKEASKYHPQVKYLGKPDKVADFLEKAAEKGDTVFTMGAGDIFTYHPQILASFKKRKGK